MIDINRIRQIQHDQLAWHIWNWRSNDEIWKNYGNASDDSDWAWDIMVHFENEDNNAEWREKEEDYNGWRKYLSEEYIKFLEAKKKA